MPNPELVISNQTQRQFILGKQGLFPGRRWRGKTGVLEALKSDSVLQVDPLNVVARSHDIVLYGRVIDYDASMLNTLLYTDRAGFDYGGTVFIYPIEELPYWRVVMARKRLEKRWAEFASEHGDIIEEVYQAVRDNGPLLSRNLGGKKAAKDKSTFRSSKVTSKALYYLWLGGELMTHSRQGFQRVYDIRERVAPSAYQHVATVEETEAYFALKSFRQVGRISRKRYRSWLAGTFERKVDQQEADGWLDALLKVGKIVEIGLESDKKKTKYYILAEDLPLLAALQSGKIPDEWQPLDNSTQEEMTFLAPLEIVSTRGRAKKLFGFEYLWEVYKPEHKRRWGYYTLPILYGDQLVARFDSKLDRESKALNIKGFWLEADTVVDEAFLRALTTGFKRFMSFVGASGIDLAETVPPDIISYLRTELP